MSTSKWEQPATKAIEEAQNLTGQSAAAAWTKAHALAAMYQAERVDNIEAVLSFIDEKIGAVADSIDHLNSTVSTKDFN